VEIFLSPLTVPLAPTGNPMDAGAGKPRPAPAADADDGEPTK
jgi:hypothetical protein